MLHITYYTYCKYKYYTLNSCLRNLNTNVTLNDCLFGSVKLTNNADPDKYKYSGCSIGCDSHSELSFIDESMGRNVIIYFSSYELILAH